jgi:hypothetical protein
VFANANREAIIASLYTAETERRVVGIPEPQAIVLDGKILNVGRERAKAASN